MTAPRDEQLMQRHHSIPRQGCLTILALAALGALPSCVETFDGSGVPAEETRPLRDFERVSSRGLLSVAITRGEFAVRVNIDDNLLSRVDTFVDAGRLGIEVSGGNLGEFLPGPHVTVSMPSLLGAELGGRGELTAEGFDEGEAVALELAGRGQLSWSGRAASVEAVLYGEGELRLDGSAGRADYYLAGEGSLAARELTAEAATIELEGGGSVTATVDGPVDATVTGSGSIELFGDVIRGRWIEAQGGTINGP